MDILGQNCKTLFLYLSRLLDIEGHIVVAGKLYVFGYMHVLIRYYAVELCSALNVSSSKENRVFNYSTLLYLYASENHRVDYSSLDDAFVCYKRIFDRSTAFIHDGSRVMNAGEYRRVFFHKKRLACDGIGCQLYRASVVIEEARDRCGISVKVICSEIGGLAITKQKSG